MLLFSRYVWKSSDWGDCQVAPLLSQQDRRLNNVSVLCGGGIQTRQLYCVQVPDNSPPHHRKEGKDQCFLWEMCWFSKANSFWFKKVFWLAICIGCVQPCLFVRLEVVEGSHLALRLISRNCTSQWKQRLDGFERGMLSWERHTDEDDSFQSMLFGAIDQWKSTVVFAFHLTQRTLTLMLTEHSRSKK